MYDLRVSCVHRRLYVTVEFGDQASYLQQETQPQAMQSAVQPTYAAILIAAPNAPSVGVACICCTLHTDLLMAYLRLTE